MQEYNFPRRNSLCSRQHTTHQVIIILLVANSFYFAADVFYEGFNIEGQWKIRFALPPVKIGRCHLGTIIGKRAQRKRETEMKKEARLDLNGK
jgi:hypothetical protein